MKTRSIFYSLLFAATLFAFFASCSADKQEQATESHEGHDANEHASGSSPTPEAGKPQFQVDLKFQEQLSGFFTSYLKLKDAFVESDAKKVKTQVSQTQDALAQVDMKLLSGAAHNDWMSYLAPIQNSLNAIQSADEIEAQRKSFSTLSDNLYKSAKAFGLGGEQAFYSHCPMAFNDEGAYWLSNKEEIRNPYFGDKMLRCGVVKEELR